MKDIIDLIARVFIAGLFFFEAIDSVFYFEQTKQTMTSYGVTWQQDFLLGSFIFLIFLGAFMVLIGYHSRIGSILLLIYYIPFTFIVFSFWNSPKELYWVTLLNFMRNISICGGLLLLTLHKPGKYSVRRLIYVMRLPN